MKSLHESTGPRPGTLCVRSRTRGIPVGLLTITLAAHLGERGMSPADVGHLLVMCSPPWAFKWMWGPVVERFSFDRLRTGRRRPWLLAAWGLGILALPPG